MEGRIEQQPSAREEPKCPIDVCKTETSAFGLIEIMNDFLGGMAYWRPKPDHALVNSGSLCLADRGRAYVVYRQSGGTITIDLPSPASGFQAEWLDPRTGAKEAAGAVEGGARRSFTCPDAHDWVLHLELGED